MTTKPTATKPTKATTAPKASTSLYNAVREHIRENDAKTLHARTQRAVEAVKSLIDWDHQ